MISVLEGMYFSIGICLKFTLLERIMWSVSISGLMSRQTGLLFLVEMIDFAPFFAPVLLMSNIYLVTSTLFVLTRLLMFEECVIGTIL